MFRVTYAIDVVLVFLLLNLNKFHTYFLVFFFVDFEQVHGSWDLSMFSHANLIPGNIVGLS